MPDTEAQQGQSLLSVKKRVKDAVGNQVDTQKESLSIASIVHAIFGLAILIIGAVNANRCTANAFIPVSFIVFGVCAIVSSLIRTAAFCCNVTSRITLGIEMAINSIGHICFLVSCIMVLWRWIIGDGVDYEPTSDKFCDPFLWVLSVIAAVLAALSLVIIPVVACVCCCCCAACCAEKLSADTEMGARSS